MDRSVSDKPPAAYAHPDKLFSEVVKENGKRRKNHDFVFELIFLSNHTIVSVPTSSVPEKSDNRESSQIETVSEEGYWYDKYTGKSFPHTVGLLPSPDGAQVYLVGTIHFSSKSCDDVSQVKEQQHLSIRSWGKKI